MGAFLRQIIALAALWALCELLLPEGGLARMARLVISLLVMTVLITSLIDVLGQWTKAGVSATESVGDVMLSSTETAAQSAEEAYAQAFLRSQANQAEDLCVRMARGAGYDAAVAVYVQTSGALDRIDLWIKGPLEPGTPPLIPTVELRQKIAVAFAADPSRVRLSVGEGEAE
jgi:stage III sporulation protein AF